MDFGISYLPTYLKIISYHPNEPTLWAAISIMPSFLLLEQNKEGLSWQLGLMLCCSVYYPSMKHWMFKLGVLLFSFYTISRSIKKKKIILGNTKCFRWGYTKYSDLIIFQCVCEYKTGSRWVWWVWLVPRHAGSQGRKMKNSDVSVQHNKMLTQ